MINTGLNTLGFIQSNSLTYTEIQNDIKTFIDALSEDEKLGFKTLFKGTNSQILINMIAAAMSDELYHIITSRSENLLYYCNRQDSATAIAQNYSYSTYRGSNLKLQLTVMPNETIVLPKFSQLGVAEEYSIINVDDLELVEGEEQTFDVYIGNIEEQTLTADTEDLLVFRFTNSDISEQIALYLDNVEVPHTKNIIEMLDDKYFCITNAYGGVDSIYLNKRLGFTHKYTNDSKLTIKYIKYEDIQLKTLELQFAHGTITDIMQSSKTIAPESVSSTRTNATLYAETQNRIVARDDFAKVFQMSNPEIADAVGRDYSNAQVEITYVTHDGNLLTATQYESAYNNLSARRGFGIPMCILSHPDIMLGLNLSVMLQLNSGSSSTVAPYVRKVLSNYEFQLGSTIDFSTIENALESYSFVKTARVYPEYRNFVANTLLPAGTTFKPTTPNGKLYVIRNILSLTGSEEPDWPTEIDSTVQDNDLIWKCEQRGLTYQIAWQSETPKQLENIVWPSNSAYANYQYRVVGYTYKNGLSEPDWPTEIGKYAADGQILWLTIARDNTANNWTSNNIISKGTIVNPTTTNALSLQAVNYIPRTSSTEPSWSTDTSIFTDGVIQYAVINEDFSLAESSESTIKLNWNQYVKFNETIQVV